MNQNIDAKPIFNLPNYISYYLRSKLLSTRWRQILLALIFLLQSALPGMVNSYIEGQQEGQYSNMAKVDALTQEGNSIKLYLGCAKYLLFFVLLFTPPKEKYNSFFPKGIGCLLLPISIMLLFTLTMLDMGYWGLKNEEREAAIREKSFKVNKREVYARVVYSGYFYDSISHRRVFNIIDNASKRSSGYVVISQIDNSYYRIPQLEDVCKDLQTNLAQLYFLEKPTLNYNFETCYLSEVHGDMLDSIAETVVIKPIPTVGEYVKLFYDPYTKYMKPYTNDTTYLTPVWPDFPNK